MDLGRLLFIAIIALAAIFLGCGAFLVLHAWWRLVWGRRRDQFVREARREVSEAVAVADPQRASLEAIRRAPAAIRTRLLLDLSRSLIGDSRGGIVHIADQLGIIAHARSTLHSWFWWRRLHAARVLQELQPEDPAVLRLLRDRHPAVRVQAADWASRYPTPEVADAVAPLLDDPDVVSRYAVQDALLRLGDVAVPAILERLTTRAGAAALPALRVALAIGEPVFAPAALRLCEDANADVRAHAVRLLGAVGGRDAAEALLLRLDDEQTQVRAAAAHALGRIGHWPAASALAARLRDRDWDVRWSAGLALRRLGSPGRLLLRKAFQDSDPFAADMARHVLDLPAGVEAAR